jgi:hypothetical protein
MVMGMAELIDRNAFRDFWNKKYRHQYANDTFMFAIANFPTTDAVPVVRCKDCKHWIHLEDGIGDCTNGRFHIHGVADITMNAEEFCCLGERRADD